MSRREQSQILKLSSQIREAQKDPKWRAEVKRFIRATT